MLYLKMEQFKRVLLLITLILFTQLCYSQSTITYKKKNKIKISEKNKRKYPRGSLLMGKMSKNMEKIEYSLIFDAKEALFKEKNIMTINPSQEYFMKLAKKYGGGDGVYYMNLKTGNKIHQKEFSSDLYLITSKTGVVKWELSQTTKMIGKYKCYKAKSNRIKLTVNKGAVKEEIIAWYTTDIALPFGPIGYGGLPGMILELETGSVVFYAKKIMLNKKNNLAIKKPIKGKKISMENYMKIVEHGARNFKRN